MKVCLICIEMSTLSAKEPKSIDLVKKVLTTKDEVSNHDLP